MKISTLKHTPLMATLLLAMSSAAMAESTGAIEHVLIIGSKEQARELPGSGHVITEEDIGKFEYSDINALLRQVPGVYLRLEEGYGLRPNIGIRSANSGPERSNKITIMEDSILVQPAPYSASAAYYSPTAGRMVGLEVLKGPAAITEGPHTVGGAINYISTAIPEDKAGKVKFETGDDGHFRAHASYGESYDNSGWLIEGYKHQADGFKSIEQVGGDTGLDKEDWLIKGRLNTDADAKVYQQLDIKLLYSDEESEQSYLGLTEMDFNSDPYRRYAVSGEDLMDVEHQQGVLTHTIKLSDELILRTSAYYHETSRNWFKVSKLGEVGDDPLSSISSVINDANSGDMAAQALLNSPDADVEIKNNNRNYRVKGIQSRLDWSFAAGEIDHEMTFGVRYHEDEEDRFQRVDKYQLRNGELSLNEVGVWGDRPNDNRLTWARAWSFYLTDDIYIGDWTITPGLRHENVKISRLRWDGPARDDNVVEGSSGSNKQSEWMPSLGATWQVNDQWMLLAGIYEGFSPAGYDEDTDPESSTNWEAGFRYQQDNLQLEVIGFYSDYDNILGECTAVASCSDDNQGDQENEGEALVKGVELTLSTDLSNYFGRNSNYELPLTLAYTWMDSEYRTSFNSDLLGQTVEKGDRLLYTPENVVSASVGWLSGPYEANLAVSYSDSTCVNTDCETSLDKTEGIFNADLSVGYYFSAGYKVYMKVENLTDEVDVISRAPSGARVQKPRSGLIGVRYDF